MQGDIRQLNDIMLDIGKLVVTQGEAVGKKKLLPLCLMIYYEVMTLCVFLCDRYNRKERRAGHH